MEEQVDRLVDKTWKRLQETPDDQRLLIGIAGVPGSGKTTLATKIVQRINARASSPPRNATEPPALMIPLDGYHHTRATLEQMPEPAVAKARRGAAFTFDAAGWTELVAKLRAPISDSLDDERSITAPSFDHAVKDPVFDDIVVQKWHRVMVMEGNYVALSAEPWASAARLMDEVWFLSVDEDRAKSRLVKRHVDTGIVETEDDGVRRVDENDNVNGRQIVDELLKDVVTERLESKEDDSWTPV